jgi:hypothetical protein
MAVRSNPTIIFWLVELTLVELTLTLTDTTQRFILFMGMVL